MNEDIIYRQAAIASAISGRVRTLPTSEDGEDWIRTSEVRESLLNLPSAEPEPRWIPVTERLPELKHRIDNWGGCWYSDQVLIYTILDDDDVPSNMYIAEYGVDDDGDPKGYWSVPFIYNTVTAEEVLAWMPLPEPYKEEEKCR